MNTTHPLVFHAEPGLCAGRLDPRQMLIPELVASLIDGHVWPSLRMSPAALGPWARTVCEHVDYELVWHEHPELFARRAQVGAPPPEVLWEARRRLAEHAVALAVDVQLETVEGELALAIYGAGTVGRLPDAAWRAGAGLLTTCCSRFCEPSPDTDRFSGLVRPARTPSSAGVRSFGDTEVVPETVNVGDVLHTWWIYPVHGSLREGCFCPAHTGEPARTTFGPVGSQS